jgi:hypothetical protein
MSLHTLIHVFFSKRPPTWFGPMALGLGWMVAILMPVLGKTVTERPGMP